jgi:UDP-GlcNAc:undecaprenyl-phosphate GlcNAc-1-phosphate transferase
MTLPILECGLLGLGVVVLLVPAILRTLPQSQFRDDLHHGHYGQVSRYGGLALAGAFIVVEVFIAVFFPEQRGRVPARLTVVLSSLAMFGLGFWDDLKPIGAKRKLAGQVLIALTVYYAGVGIELFKVPFSGRIIELHGWGGLLTVLWLVGLTNLLNLIDGVDGLAGGIALMLLGLLVYVGYQNGTFVLLTAGMTGAVLGFLWFNFPPARIYLGDGGAYFLGFQIGLYSLISSHKGTVLAALLAPLFVLALPIVDTCLAIIRRGLRGLPVFRPDRRHIHHHLLEMGLSRRQVVLWSYGFTLVFLVMALAVLWSRANLFPVLLGVAVLLLLVCAGRLSFSREWLAVGRTVGNSLGMRQEIQYALTLMRWLRHEGRRCGSLEELFGDLVFAAQRLGFSSVKMTSRNGERSWGQSQNGSPLRTFRQELGGGELGALELRAGLCQERSACQWAGRDNVRGRPCPCAKDPRLFELMSELVTEGWLRALGNSRCPGGGLRCIVPDGKATSSVVRAGLSSDSADCVNGPT